uniref:Uncharacterized protein n=1 Tax=Ditylenchus dipsaci TaxID=166011 RepID=A0A915DIF3_9BILA
MPAMISTGSHRGNSGNRTSDSGRGRITQTSSYTQSNKSRGSQNKLGKAQSIFGNPARSAFPPYLQQLGSKMGDLYKVSEYAQLLNEDGSVQPHQSINMKWADCLESTGNYVIPSRAACDAIYRIELSHRKLS